MRSRWLWERWDKWAKMRRNETWWLKSILPCKLCCQREGIVIKTDTHAVNSQPISSFTFCCLHQSWCLYRADGNAECVGNNFYNRTTNNGFEILWTQNNRPRAGEGGGNKIFWTKEPLGADMNILIQKFTNKHQDLRSHLCPEDYVTSPGPLSMYHSLRRSVTEKQTRGPGLCVRWKERKKGTTCLVRSHSSYLHPFPSYNFPRAVSCSYNSSATKHFQSEISGFKFLPRYHSPVTRSCQHDSPDLLIWTICSTIITWTWSR